MSTDVREALIAQGWKQGALILKNPNDEFIKLAHCELAEDDVFLVISQTCDLVNPDFNAEPYFEVLRLKILDGNPGGEFLGGKNSRQIHFQVQIGDRVVTFCAVPFDKFYVDRQLLLSLSPNDVLPEELRVMVNAWLSRRYIRTAFPDNFDKRWKARIRQIERVIKRLEKVTDIYIKIVPFDELDESEDYEVEIVLLMDDGDFNDQNTYAEYMGHRKSLDDQFSKCNGIDLKALDIRSDADITVRELVEMHRWDYSYLSYRDPEEHVGPSSVGLA